MEATPETLSHPTSSSAQSQSPATKRTFLSTKAAANFAAWNLTPLTIVAANNGGLQAYSGGWDSAKAHGAPTQRYSSYSCLASSSVSLVDVVPDKIVTSSQASQTTAEEDDIREPTAAEIAKLSAAKRNSYLAGELSFSKAYGFLPLATIMSKRQRAQRGDAIVMTNTVAITPTTPTIAPAVGETTETQTDQSLPQASASTSGTAGTSERLSLESPGTRSRITSTYVPIRVMSPVTVTPIAQPRQPPFSQIYTTYAEALASDTATAVKASVKTPLMRETTSWYTLTKVLSQERGEFRDTAPLVRLLNLASSLCPDTARLDWTLETFARNLRDVTYKNTIITHPAKDYPECKMVAMPIDVFIPFLTGLDSQHRPPSNFPANLMDKEWTAIPISSEIQNSSCIFEYINSFITSATTFGSVSHHYTATTTNGDVKVDATTMPASTLTYIPGPQNIVLVLTDASSSSVPWDIQLKGLSVPVYTGKTPPALRDQPRVETADFSTAWKNWYITSNISVIRDNIASAWTSMINNIAVEETVGLALVLAAESSAVMRQGMYLNPKKTMGYDTQRPLSGAVCMRWDTYKIP